MPENPDQSAPETEITEWENFPTEPGELHLGTVDPDPGAVRVGSNDGFFLDIGSVYRELHTLNLVMAGTTMVRINADGTVEFGDNYEPDLAARTFWRALATFPARDYFRSEKGLVEAALHDPKVTWEIIKRTHENPILGPWERIEDFDGPIYVRYEVSGKRAVTVHHSRWICPQEGRLCESDEEARAEADAYFREEGYTLIDPEEKELDLAKMGKSERLKKRSV